jgi:hypothetical protein
MDITAAVLVAWRRSGWIGRKGASGAFTPDKMMWGGRRARELIVDSSQGSLSLSMLCLFWVRDRE